MNGHSHSNAHEQGNSRHDHQATIAPPSPSHHHDSGDHAADRHDSGTHGSDTHGSNAHGSGGHDHSAMVDDFRDYARLPAPEPAVSQ